LFGLLVDALPHIHLLFVSFLPLPYLLPPLLSIFTLPPLSLLLPRYLPPYPFLSSYPSQGLLEHQLIDPLEGIMQLRKIIYHFAAIPRLLGSELVVPHIVSKDLLEIFEVR
jgi:hypothetical protein